MFIPQQHQQQPQQFNPQAPAGGLHVVPGNPPVPQQQPQAPPPQQQAVGAPPAVQYSQAPPQPQQHVPVQHAPPQPAPAPQAHTVPPVSGGSSGMANVTSGTEEILQQNQAYAARIRQMEEENQRQEEEKQRQEMATMKPWERVEKKVDLWQQKSELATQRANEWRIEAEVEKLFRQYEDGLDANKLDRSSVESLYASVPVARASYEQLEHRIAEKIARETGLSRQHQIEGLPPAPGYSGGLPSPNSASNLPAYQGGPYGPQGAQQMHPQLARDNYSASPMSMHGRVYQPAPGTPAPTIGPNGQYFTPQYHQPPHAQAYAQQPQQMQMAAPQQMQMASQQMVQQPMPQQMMQAQQPAQGNLEAVKEQARASIQKARSGGMAGLAAKGMGEGHTNSGALANQGASPIQAQSLPDPTQFAAHGQGMHPMHLASNGV